MGTSADAGAGRGGQWGALVVSALALVVSFAALWVSADSARGDRQARFDDQKAHCLAEIDTIADALIEVYYVSHQEVRRDRALVNRLRSGPGDFRRACVLSGVIPEGSDLEDPISTIDAGLQVSFVPFNITLEGETDADRDERMTRVLAEYLYQWGSVLGQAETYVRALPGVPFLPWEEREVPDVTYDPEQAKLEEPDSTADE